jgi:predicted amidohydrolase YtcJ
VSAVKIKVVPSSYKRISAYAEFQDHCKGQLIPGYLADLVLLSNDVYKNPPEELKNVRPLMTIMDGRIVYEA